jgi:hypothetical protein
MWVHGCGLFRISTETVSVRSEEGSIFSTPKLTPNPVHVALHTIPAVPAKKKIR